MVIERAFESDAGGLQPSALSPLLLEARNLQKSFAGVVALSDGTLELRHNEIHAVVGDNGAGKSTLLKIISGALQPDGGELLLDGQPITLSDPSAARRVGISTVFQDLALINHLDAAANMFLGREIVRPGWPAWLGVLDKSAMRQAAESEIRRLKIGVRSVEQLVAGMSGGQRQAIAVARAVAFGSRIVVMDEPTAALGVREGGAVLEMIREIKASGLAVIVISHNMPDVFKVADRITVMRLGQMVTTVRREDTSLAEIVGYMTGAFGGAEGGPALPGQGGPAT